MISNAGPHAPTWMSKLTKVVLVILIAAAALRLFLTLNLPIQLLANAGHDDGLFMRLAINLASGRWLGGFNQFTLMKGPGYPVFLAITGLSGLPVSATHALFQIAAIAVSAWAVYRLTGSRTISALTFIILLFYPVGFMPETLRVLRDQIYWPQTLLVFSLFTLLLFTPPGGRFTAILVAGLAGSITGWAWLTREEGIWFVPGLSLLVLVAILINRKEKSELLALARNLAVAAIGFIAVNAAYMTGNLFAYGSFVGVDFKEQNFKSALEALEDVDAGPVVPYVPVPGAARAAVAEVSPTFAPLSVELAPNGSLSGWTGAGCRIYSHTCGDYAGGWFMWALRDAAADSNFYQSPKTASQNFGKIANEIAAACADGRLRCRHRWMIYMPRMTGQQWASLPRALFAVVESTIFLSPPNPNEMRPSSALTGEFERYWEFLNFPHITRSEQRSDDIVVRGWFRDSESSEWPAFKAYAEDGQEIPSSTTRVRSADIQRRFSDSEADYNRFEISFRCPNRCTITAPTSHHPELRIAVVENRSLSVSSGSATLYVDSAAGAPAPAKPSQTLAAHMRVMLVQIYKLLMPLLLLAGLIAAVIAVWRAVGARTLDAVLLTALAAWVFVGTRIALLTLIEVSSFPAAIYKYSGPANYMAVVAAILSIASLRGKSPSA